MLSAFSRMILRLAGWKIQNVIPQGTKKCVIIAAPHTSYWDFAVGRLAYWVIGVKARFLIKKEAFKFPFKKMLLRMGGIPVDRSKSNNMVEQVVDMFNKSESLYVVITPEGTRKPVKHWKKGFYHIALAAQVPIALGFLDYGTKRGGVGKVIFPSGDLNAQMLEIKEFYKGMRGKFPEGFSEDIR